MPCVHHTFGQIFTYDTYVKTMYGTHVKSEKKISFTHFRLLQFHIKKLLTESNK